MMNYINMHRDEFHNFTLPEVDGLVYTHHRQMSKYLEPREYWRLIKTMNTRQLTSLYKIYNKYR